jgi:hypothetical protein
MVRALRALLPALLMILSAAVPTAAESTDLLLVLAADVSRSIDRTKFELQRQGYAAAIADPLVLSAIRSGRHRRIAISFIEWSGAQKVVIDWTEIGDAESAHAFADQLLESPRSFADRTSISGGIDFAMMQFARAPYEGARRTIDLSGDGDNNAGRDVNLARDEAVVQGVTVNGLVILTERNNAFSPQHTNPLGGLEKYYRDNVIGGPSSFVMVAQNFDSFGQAILNKLIAEIALTNLPRHAGIP